MEEEEKQKDSKEKSMRSAFAKFKKLDTKKKIQYAVILLITVVIIAIFFASTDNSSQPQTLQPSEIENQSGSLEERLKKALSSIEGAGRVEVMITYETSGLINPAISVDTQTTTTTDSFENGNSTTSTQNTQSEIVTVSGSDGNRALVLSEHSPQIKGVLVVAEGADDISVMLNLLNAVQTVLDVLPSQVDVYKMNKE